MNDCLIVGVDFSTNDDTDMLIIMRRKGEKAYVVNLLKDEEALEIYNKLIGVKNE